MHSKFVKKIFFIFYLLFFICFISFLIRGNIQRILGTNSYGKLFFILSVVAVIWLIVLHTKKSLTDLFIPILKTFLFFGVLFNLIFFNKISVQLLPEIRMHDNSTLTSLNQTAIYSDYDYPLYFYYYDFQRSPSISYQDDSIFLKYGIRPEFLKEWGNTVLFKDQIEFTPGHYTDSLIIKNYNKDFTLKNRIIVTNSKTLCKRVIVKEVNDSCLYFYQFE